MPATQPLMTVQQRVTEFRLQVTAINDVLRQLDSAVAAAVAATAAPTGQPPMDQLVDTFRSRVIAIESAVGPLRDAAAALDPIDAHRALDLRDHVEDIPTVVVPELRAAANALAGAQTTQEIAGAKAAVRRLEAAVAALGQLLGNEFRNRLMEVQEPLRQLELAADAALGQALPEPDPTRFDIYPPSTVNAPRWVVAIGRAPAWVWIVVGLVIAALVFAVIGVPAFWWVVLAVIFGPLVAAPVRDRLWRLAGQVRVHLGWIPARWWLRFFAIVSVVALIYTLLAAWFAPPCRPPVGLFILAVFWGVVPPLFWWFQWFYVFPKYRNEHRLETFKYGAQSALAIWAAVVVALAAYSTSDFFKPAAPDKDKPGQPGLCLYEARQFHGRWSLRDASTWSLSADVPVQAPSADAQASDAQCSFPASCFRTPMSQ
ncbi:EI24 domain-containing protein [Paraburkholderia sp. BR10937]|uniref:EI24 domain-containing protein n=1 Tax=Paraburkholderia sp. BR10937 TaxID=3236994 RepID=UPI0034D34E61